MGYEVVESHDRQRPSGTQQIQDEDGIDIGIQFLVTMEIILVDDYISCNAFLWLLISLK